MGPAIQTIEKQLLAAMATLGQCIKNCPDADWDQSHGDAPYCQVVFHTLFYLDFYLSGDEESFKAQDFHTSHRSFFRDYEELIDKIPENRYVKPEIDRYFTFCLGKTHRTLGKMEDDRILDMSGHKGMTYIELFIYITRHIQHHSAQLGLRLQQKYGHELDWVSSRGRGD